MRNLLFIFILVLPFVSSSTAFSQTKTPPKTEQEIKTLLCHKWKLTAMEAKGQKVELPPDMGNSFVSFKNDGTLVETDEGKDYQGRWTYDHRTMTLTTNDKDGIENQKIVKISEVELIIKSKWQEITMNLIMKRVD